MTTLVNVKASEVTYNALVSAFFPHRSWRKRSTNSHYVCLRMIRPYCDKTLRADHRYDCS